MLLVDPFISTLGLVVLTGAGLGFVVYFASRLGVISAALSAVVLRIAVGAWILETGGLGRSDAGFYDMLGRQLAIAWQGLGDAPTIPGDRLGWPALLAVEYTAFGHVPLAGVLVNALAAGLCVCLVASVAGQIGGRRAQRPAAWLMALWPSGVVWGSLLVRESLVMLCLALACWAVVKMDAGFVRKGLLALVASAFGLALLRLGLVGYVLVGLPAILLVWRRVGHRIVRRPSVARYGVMVVASAALAMLALQLATRGGFGGVALSEERVATVSEALDTGATGFGQAGVAAITGIGSLLIRPLLILVGPFPWQASSPALLIAALEGLGWAALWMFAFRGLGVAARRRAGEVLLIGAVLLAAYLALVATNFGLIVRLRALLLPAVIPAAAIAIAHVSPRLGVHARSREATISRPLAAAIKGFSSEAEAQPTRTEHTP